MTHFGCIAQIGCSFVVTRLRFESDDGYLAFNQPFFKCFNSYLVQEVLDPGLADMIWCVYQATLLYGPDPTINDLLERQDSDPGGFPELIMETVFK